MSHKNSLSIDMNNYYYHSNTIILCDKGTVECKT